MLIKNLTFKLSSFSGVCVMPIRKEAKNRKLIQLVLLPVFFLVVLAGQFYPQMGFLAIGMMVYMIAQAFTKGRHYCGWICSMGAFHDRVLARFSLNQQIPPVLSARWFRYLVFVLMMGLMMSRFVMSAGDPVAIAGVFVMMWTLSTCLAVGLGFLFRPRSWCNICPMALVQGVIGKNANLLKVADNCKDCGLCKKVCPVELDPASFKHEGHVPSSKCIRCASCVVNCPVGALSLPTVVVPFSNVSPVCEKACAE